MKVRYVDGALWLLAVRRRRRFRLDYSAKYIARPRSLVGDGRVGGENQAAGIFVVSGHIFTVDKDGLNSNNFSREQKVNQL